MKYSSDEATVKQKMKMTFEYRRNMVLDEEKSSDVLTEFPRFKDVKGLVIEYFTEKCALGHTNVINVLTATLLSPIGKDHITILYV